MKAKPILHLNTGYSSNGFDAVIDAQQGSQVQVYSARLINESGSSSDLALLQALAEDAVTIYTYDGATATDVTDSLSAGVDLFTSTAGSGIIIETAKKIESFLVNVSTAQSGAQTFTVEYSDGGALQSALQVSYIPTTFSAGQHAVLFSHGLDYAPGCGITGTDNGKYQIVLACVEGGESAQIDALKAAISVQYSPAVANNSSLEAAFSEQYPLMLEAGESIVPFFESESANNKVIAFYQFQN
jgi:hypothetical protein